MRFSSAAALAAFVSALQTQYIVELKTDENSELLDNKMDLQWVNDILQKNNRGSDSNSNKIISEFDMGSKLQAFAVKTTQETVDEIKLDPRVERVVVDKKVVLFQWPFGGSAWGIDRSDQRSLPLDKVYNETSKNHGEGVTVYIIDTGINAAHVEFEGRASEGPSFVDAQMGTDSSDKLGHGTHCAGTIASKSYGIARKAKVVGISIFGTKDTASTASVIAALNYVYKTVLFNLLGSKWKICCFHVSR